MNEVILFSVFENLPQEKSIKQLKRIRKATKKVTIDDAVQKETENIPNGLDVYNPFDRDIETQQDFWKNNEK